MKYIFWSVIVATLFFIVMCALCNSAQASLPLKITDDSDSLILQYYAIDTSGSYTLPDEWQPWTSGPIEDIWEGWGTPNPATVDGLSLLTARANIVATSVGGTYPALTGIWLSTKLVSETTSLTPSGYAYKWEKLSNDPTTIPSKTTTYGWVVSCQVNGGTMSKIGSHTNYDTVWSDINNVLADLYATYGPTSELDDCDISVTTSDAWEIS